MRWTNLPEFDAVPCGWSLAQLQKEATFVFGQSPDSEHYNEKGQGLPFLQGNADFTDTFPQTSVFTRQAGKKCDAMDTLISVRAPVGELCRADQEYALGRGVAALRPLSMDSDFFFHAMNRWRKPLQRAAQGSTFDAVTGRHFSQLRCLVPPPEEQTRISETLKAADDYIGAVEEQIHKAERMNTALLQSLLVVGLPGSNFPSIESKIGPIPSHWVFQRLGKTFREPPFNGVSPESRPNPPGTPILNVSCVNDGICSVEAVTYVDVDEATIRSNSAEKGDFFVLRGNGNRDYVGTGGWLRVNPPDDCIFSDKLIRLRFDNSRVVEGFYPYLWQSRSFQIRLQSKAQSSSGLWMMNKRDIAREWVALPPKDEQTEMVKILDSASETLSVLRGQLIFARRVKQSLLQNLLTGKIRLTG
jgi:type I restriction enzyme S subunit